MLFINAIVFNLFVIVTCLYSILIQQNPKHGDHNKNKKYNKRKMFFFLIQKHDEKLNKRQETLIFHSYHVSIIILKK